MIARLPSRSVAGVASHQARAAGEGRSAMSKLARTLMLGATLVAMNLAAATAVAQEQTTTDDAAEVFRAGERASQQQTVTDDPAELFRASERALREQTTSDDAVGATPAEAIRPARPAGPSGRLGLLVALGVLAAALAAMTARRATRRVRARQAI